MSFGQPSQSENPTRGGTHIIYPWTVRDCKAQLLANATAWAAAMQASCNDPKTMDAWKAFYDPLVAFCHEDVSIFGLGSQMDRCQSWEDALWGWQTQIKGSCPGIVAPVIDPNPVGPPSVWAGVAKWTAIAAVTIGAAYGVSRVIELIPTAAERAEARRLGPKSAAPAPSARV